MDVCCVVVELLATTPPSEPMQAADLGRRPPDGHAASELSSGPEFNPSAARKQSAKTAGKSTSKPSKERIARPMNSFMIFAREFRAEMREKYPDIDNKDISKMLGQEWKSLSAERKKVYYDKAAIVSDQHKRDHPDWKFVRAPPRSKNKDKNADEPAAPRVKTKPSPANDSIAAGGRGTPLKASDHDSEYDEDDDDGDDDGDEDNASHNDQVEVGAYSVQRGHLDTLRDLHVEQSKLMLQQEDIEIQTLIAGQPQSPNLPPPSYVPPPALVFFSSGMVTDESSAAAAELAMMSQHSRGQTQPFQPPVSHVSAAPTAVARPAVHPQYTHTDVVSRPTVHPTLSS